MGIPLRPFDEELLPVQGSAAIQVRQSPASFRPLAYWFMMDGNSEAAREHRDEDPAGTRGPRRKPREIRVSPHNGQVPRGHLPERRGPCPSAIAGPVGVLTDADG